MKVKLYRLQSLVNQELMDRVNQATKKLGISQGELVREAVLLYLNLMECTGANHTEQQNETKPISALLKLLEKK